MANISQIKLPDNTVYSIKDSNAGPRPIVHIEMDFADTYGMPGIYLDNSELPDGLKDGQVIFVIIDSSNFINPSNVNIDVYIDMDTINAISIYLNNDTRLTGYQLRIGCSFILVYSAQNNKFYAFGLPVAA